MKNLYNNKFSKVTSYHKLPVDEVKADIRLLIAQKIYWKIDSEINEELLHDFLNNIYKK